MRKKADFFDATHALIVGEPGVGKSTLIHRVRQMLSVPVIGFETEKEPSLAVKNRGIPVYIHKIGKSREYTAENLVAYVGTGKPEIFPHIFEDFSWQVEACREGSGLIVMDELGFLESASPRFCNAVLGLLAGDTPILAAVKPKDTEFLRAVRSHPNCRVFRIDRKNRETLLRDVLDFLQIQYDK